MINMNAKPSNKLKERGVEDNYNVEIDDYILLRHKVYGFTLYTFIGKVKGVWFPNSLNGGDRYVSIELLYSDDDYCNTDIGGEVSIDLTKLDPSKEDEFRIINEETALAMVL